MSGHSNFSAIEGVRPTLPAIQQPGEDIGVSLNKSVGGVKAPGAADVGDGSENVPLQEVDNGAEKASALLRQLDVLLARAAESATKGIDAVSLKTTLSQVNLSKGDRKTLNTAADNADAAFKAINKFTGYELAASVSAKDGKFGWDMTNPAGEAIKKALDAQMELSDKLRQVVNQLPQGELADSLEEALMQCDRRCCEIQTLVCQFADILENDPIPKDQAVVDRLSQTLERLLPRQALQMHGNDAAIAAMKKTVEPLAKRLDDLSKTQGQGAQLSNEEVAAIGREIDTMANALKDAAKRGVAGDSGIGVDRTLFTAAKDILDAVGGRLVNARREIAMESMVNFAEKTFAPLPIKILDPKFLPILKVLSPVVGQFVSRRENLRKAAVEYAKNPSGENYGKLKAAADEYAKSKGAKYLLMQGITRLAESLERAIVGRVGDREKEKSVADALTAAVKNSKKLEADEKAAAKKLAVDFAKLYIPFAQDVFVDTEENEHTLLALRFAGVSNGAPSQAVHLKLMHETAEQMSNADFLTSDTVRAAFEGKLRFTTLVEARLHGLRDEDVDPKLDDVNHVSSVKRGSGALNTVYEVGYKDGKSFIFKPEAPGRQAMENLSIAKGIEATQMVAQLNIASQKTADALGLGDVMVKTTVGSHNGEFGIFMEKAKGVDAEDFAKLGKSVKPPEGDLSLLGIKNLDGDKYAKVVGGLMRQANRLEWFDMITGQGDRHAHNFFVSVGKDGTVSLKGIDNDACFPEYRTGIRTFQLSKDKADLLKKVIEKTAEGLFPQYPGRRGRLLNELMTDPGIKFHDDGTATVTTTEFKSPILHYCILKTVGMHTTALPDYIDKELYDNLMALAEPGERREKFIADLTANLPEGAKDAAISRLDDAIDYAKTLSKKERVVSAEAWVDHDKQREIAGEVPPAPTKRYHADVVPVGSSLDAKAEVGMWILHLTEGYFRRNIMRAVAKPGWFDE